MFGKSNINNLIIAVMTLVRTKANDDIEVKIQSFDGATYNTVSDNEKVTITGSRITPYSRICMLFADNFAEISVQTK